MQHTCKFYNQKLMETCISVFDRGKSIKAYLKNLKTVPLLEYSRNKLIPGTLHMWWHSLHSHWSVQQLQTLCLLEILLLSESERENINVIFKLSSHSLLSRYNITLHYILLMNWFWHFMLYLQLLYYLWSFYLTWCCKQTTGNLIQSMTINEEIKYNRNSLKRREFFLLPEFSWDRDDG